jgi:PAS domain S-box-containing protein
MRSPRQSERRSARSPHSLTAADYRHLLDLVKVIVWRADARTFQTTFASLQAEELLGYPLAAWTEVANFWFDHVHPDDRQWVVEFMESQVRQHRSYDFEYRMIAADGRTLWLRNIVNVIVEQGRAVELIGTAVDITQRKQMEHETARLRHQLISLSRLSSLGELAVALAHELSQPLGAISSNAETAELLLEPMRSRGGAELAAVIADIRRDVQRAATIIESVRALVQHEILPRHPVEMAAAVTTVTSMLKSLLVSRDIEIVLDLPPTLPKLSGNVIELQQLFYNLILNAIEAIAPVGRTPRRITISARVTPTGQVEAFVSDTGPGIDVSMLPHIFEPLLTNKTGGMGIGLAMCRRIVEACGGEIDAFNNPEGGATLHFTLPAAEHPVAVS